MELITLWGALITARNDEIIKDYLALQHLTPLVHTALGRRWLWARSRVPGTGHTDESGGHQWANSVIGRTPYSKTRWVELWVLPHARKIEQMHHLCTPGSQCLGCGVKAEAEHPGQCRVNTVTLVVPLLLWTPRALYTHGFIAPWKRCRGKAAAPWHKGGNWGRAIRPLVQGHPAHYMLHLGMFSFIIS